MSAKSLAGLGAPKLNKSSGCRFRLLVGTREAFGAGRFIGVSIQGSRVRPRIKSGA
jgi:hypothetical protein